MILLVLVHYRCSLLILGHLGCVSAWWYRRLATYQCPTCGRPISLSSPLRSAYVVPIQCLHSSWLFWNHFGRVRWSSRYCLWCGVEWWWTEIFLCCSAGLSVQVLCGNQKLQWDTPASDSMRMVIISSVRKIASPMPLTHVPFVGNINRSSFCDDPAGLGGHRVKIYVVAHPAMPAEQELKLAFYTRLPCKQSPIHSLGTRLAIE